MSDVRENTQRFGIFKRKHERFGIHGLTAHIADGNMVQGGVVTDISAGGFKMARIADTFAVEKHCYAAMITGEGKRYKVLVKPCWGNTDADSRTQEIGFKIVDASWEWLEFVLNSASDVYYEDDWRGFA